MANPFKFLLSEFLNRLDFVNGERHITMNGVYLYAKIIGRWVGANWLHGDRKITPIAIDHHYPLCFNLNLTHGRSL
jgi:hypothetical protein